MIINKEVLGKLLLAAGHGQLVSISEITVDSPLAKPWQWEGEVDFNLIVEIATPETDASPQDTFSPTEVLEALKEKFDIANNVVTLDMREPNTHNEVTLETISHKQAPKEVVKKPRQLKRLGQLKGLTIESVKMVKQGTKAYIKTTEGAGICIEGVNVIQTLAPDENIALGLLTKEDLASIAKAKKMGLLL